MATRLATLRRHIGSWHKAVNEEQRQRDWPRFGVTGVPGTALARKTRGNAIGPAVGQATRLETSESAVRSAALWRHIGAWRAAHREEQRQ